MRQRVNDQWKRDVRARLKELLWNYADLASKVGCSREAISVLLTTADEKPGGKVSEKSDFAEVIAELLGVPLPDPTMRGELASISQVLQMIAQLQPGYPAGLLVTLRADLADMQVRAKRWREFSASGGDTFRRDAAAAPRAAAPPVAPVPQLPAPRKRRSRGG